MRRVGAIPRRYARALLDVAVREGREDELGGEIQALGELFRMEPRLRSLLSDPLISESRKEEVLGEIVAAARPSEAVARLLAEMLRHGRMGRLPEVADGYAMLLDERRGIVEAEVTTVEELGEGREGRLRSRLEELTGKKVRILGRQDPSILGGVVVKIGDVVYDGSVTNRLEQARRELEAEVPGE